MIDEALLNPAQREAVEYVDGPQLVIAGAGSGKTRVLTYKIAHLLQLGLKPWNILALTFTNKAAREMKQRIASVVGQEGCRGLWMGTFHSIFLSILRIEAQTIGFQPHITIYDTEDSQKLLKAIVREMQLDEKTYAPKAVAQIISQAKELLQTPQAFNASLLAQKPVSGQIKTAALIKVYTLYQQRLKQANAMDFDDILFYTYFLLHDNEELRLRYAQRFAYVLVDEYQDTNHVQHEIIKLLTREHQHLCVVGDDAQSIYSFRGANIDNILSLETTFPNLRIFKLERNYRSTQTIVKAANSVIQRNRRQYRKDVYSENAVGEPLRLIPAFSDKDEANQIALRIVMLCRRYAFKDIAILYRQNFQSRALEEVLRINRLPYRIYGGLSFYQRKEVKDVIAYCRLAVNPNDEEAFRRIVNYPTRGIGAVTVAKVIESQAGAAPTGTLLSFDHIKLSAATHAKLTAFADLIQSFAQSVPTTNAATLLEDIIERSGIRNDLKRGLDLTDQERRKNVEELINAAQAFVDERTQQGESCTLADYLQEVSLMSDMDRDDQQQGDDRISLMTIHASKGLEFPIVIVVGMEDELFPGDRSYLNPGDIEEERRLFYVAITRAGEQCILSYAKMRYKYGQLCYETPSRFLREIDKRYILTVKRDRF